MKVAIDIPQTQNCDIHIGLISDPKLGRVYIDFGFGSSGPNDVKVMEYRPLNEIEFDVG